MRDRERRAFQPGTAQQVELESLARHDPRFDAPRRAGKRDHVPRVAPQQFARDGDARIQVAARAAAGDHDAHRLHASGVPTCRS